MTHIQKGRLLGNLINHSRKQLTQVILEGVAFALMGSFEINKFLGVKIDIVRITGGGT